MNSLIKHGGINVSKNKKYLEHEDGIPFFWLADTWWYGMTSRARWEDFKILVKDRKKKGFTVIQTVVGVPPEVDIFSKYAANSGGLPFITKTDVIPAKAGIYSNKNYIDSHLRGNDKGGSGNDDELTINLKYFDEVDRKIKYLVDSGLVPCIFGAWGLHIDILGVDLIKRWWGEIVRRYGRYPVVWCLTGEADIFPPSYSPQNSLVKKVLSKTPIWFNNSLIRIKKEYAVISNEVRNLAKRIYLKATLPLDSSVASLPRNDIVISNKIKERLKKWDEVARYVKKIDRYKRLMTVHVHSRVTASELFEDPPWLDIDSIQSGHAKDSLDFMKKAIKEGSNKGRPIINLEPWYEGILGNFGQRMQLQAFWACIKAGAAGHSYGAHGIWQMAADKDNFMGHWGRSDWRKTINYKGAEALGYAKRKLEKNWPIIVKLDLI